MQLMTNVRVDAAIVELVERISASQNLMSRYFCKLRKLQEQLVYSILNVLPIVASCTNA